MKSNDNGIAMPISKSTLNELLNETKETLATGIQFQAPKSNFSAIDLWKVQRQQRSSLDLRRRLN